MPGSLSKLTGRAFVAIAMLGGQSMAGGGEYRGTPQQPAACTADAFRLCLDHSRDADKVGLSLLQRKGDLRASWRPALERTGSAAARSDR